MTKDRTTDQPAQPCIGPEGHRPADDTAYWSAVPGYPDLQLYYLHAPIGKPCLGRYIRNIGTGFDVMDIPHVDTIFINTIGAYADIQARPAPLVIAARVPSGAIQLKKPGLAALPRPQQKRVLAAWAVAYRDLILPVGRPALDIEAHIAELHAEHTRLTPICAQLKHGPNHPTYRECLAKSGVQFNTSRERLRDAKQPPWETLKAQWVNEVGG